MVKISALKDFLMSLVHSTVIRGTVEKKAVPVKYFKVKSLKLKIVLWRVFCLRRARLNRYHPSTYTYLKSALLCTS